MADAAGVDVLGRVASGLFIVTCEGKSQRHAFLASWVTQAGFSPPAPSVAIKQDRPIMRDMKPGTLFCVNVLAKDDPESKKLMGRFAKGVPIGEDAFADADVGTGAAGCKFLPGALGYMECRLMRVLEPSTEHNLIVGEIVGGAMLREGEPWVHVRKTGSQY
jgi:flavin reductase (DIM6/NTAB) family NADH-FMN oxidoreductase RutF